MDNSSSKAIEEVLKSGKASVAEQTLSPADQPNEHSAGTPEAGLHSQHDAAAQPSRIRFECNKENRQFQAVLEAGPPETPLDMEHLQTLLSEQGTADVMLADGVLEGLLARALNGELGIHELATRPALLMLSFSFSETDSILYATLAPGEVKQEISVHSVENWLRKKGYDTFFREPDVFDTLLARIEEGKAGRFVFSSKRDAEVLIKVSSDKMQATVTTHPAYGGKQLDSQMIRQALQEANIDHRFHNSDMINELLAGPPVENRILATGVPAEHGTNARLEFLVREIISKEPREDEHGNINPHEQNDFVLVEPGTPVLRKEPATDGKDGYNVCGKRLPATPGKDLNFSNSLSGVGPDPDNPNQLIALIKGHPVILRTTVKVDPVLHLGEVDVKSGDINFDGTVNINGDVHAGMVVTASGDVHIHGSVEKATIVAGNDIYVRGGIIGGDTGKDGKKTAGDEHREATGALDPVQPVFKSSLHAAGSISARYISHTELECAQDLVVAEYLLHSSAVVHGQLLLGQAGGKGCLIGGYCHASKGIIVKELGNEHYLKTRISIGYSQTVLNQLQELNEEKEKQSAILAKLNEGLNTLKMRADAPESALQHDDKTEKLQHAISLVSAELERLELQHQTLLTTCGPAEELRASVTRRSFPNVLLGIDGVELKIDKETATGHFQVEHGKIRFSSQHKTGVNVSSLRKDSPS